MEIMERGRIHKESKSKKGKLVGVGKQGKTGWGGGGGVDRLG